MAELKKQVKTKTGIANQQLFLSIHRTNCLSHAKINAGTATTHTTLKGSPQLLVTDV